jgi:hypothetical protein
MRIWRILRLKRWRRRGKTFSMRRGPTVITTRLNKYNKFIKLLISVYGIASTQCLLTTVAGVNITVQKEVPLPPEETTTVNPQPLCFPYFTTFLHTFYSFTDSPFHIFFLQVTLFNIFPGGGGGLLSHRPLDRSRTLFSEKSFISEGWLCKKVWTLWRPAPAVSCASGLRRSWWPWAACGLP